MNLKSPVKWLAMPMVTILMLVSFFLGAQVNRRDVVYLKNGSIIKGDILEVIPTETIKIKTSDGSIFVFKMEEVDRTGKEEQEIKEIRKEEPKADVTNEQARPKQTGYFLIVRLGPNAHLDNTSSDFSAGIINGVQISEYMSFGVGAEATGYVYDKNSNSSVTIFPFFFDARFYIPKGKIVQPMFSIQLGYSIVGNKKKRGDSGNSYPDFEPDSGDGGLFFGVNGGVRLQLRKRMAVMVDGGISMQKLNGKQGYSLNSTLKEIPSIRGNIGICWNFGSPKK